MTFDELRAKRQAAIALSDSLESRGDTAEMLVVLIPNMEMVAYSQVRGAWEAHFKNRDHPDFRIVVSHIGHTLYTDVYQQVNRFSRVDQDSLFDMSYTD